MSERSFAERGSDQQNAVETVEIHRHEAATVGAVDDPQEREAENIGAHIARVLHSSGSAACAPTSTRIRRSSRGRVTGASGFADDERLQRSVDGVIGSAGGALDADTEQRLETARSGGRPLDHGTKSDMEGAFGADFSAVRVHTGPDADELSRRIQASAFTTGSDIFFSGGEPDTSSAEGTELLAHELTHTLQQRGIARSPMIRRRVGQVSQGTKVRQISSDRTGTIFKVADNGDGTWTYKVRFGIVPETVESTDDDYEPAAASGGPAAVFHAVSPGLVNATTSSAADRGINDAARLPSGGDHAEVNCALVTIAAIVGKQASEASEDVQQRLGGRASGNINKDIQSHNLWAMQLMAKDVEPLEALGLIEKINDPLFPEGNAYVVGEAQLHGMLRYLTMTLGSPTAPSSGPPPPPGLASGPPPPPGGTQWHLYQHGEPGTAMFTKSELVPAMTKYPDGTRFAVFVFDPKFGGGTGGHWVYAERNTGGVAFVDFQKNKTGGRGPAKPSETKDELPWLDPKDEAKGQFDQGMFIAIAPPATGGGLAFDPAVSESSITKSLADARLRLRTLQETRKVDDGAKALPKGFFADDPSAIRIPSPKLVDEAAKETLADYGVTGVNSRLGNDPTTWNIFIAGHPRVDAKGVADTPDLRDRVSLIGASGDTGEDLPAFTKARNVDDLKVALDKQGDLSAEAKADYMWINAGRFAFTDLIHEVIHTYEGGSYSTLMAEGLADYFALRVGEKLVAKTSKPEFSYVANSGYDPMRYRMENLIAVLGRNNVASLYFTEGSTEDKLTAILRKENLVDGKNPAQVKEIVNQLRGNDPDGFDAGFLAIRGAKDVTHDDSALASAGGAPPTDPMRAELRTLYDAMGAATGASYLAMSKRARKIEQGLAALTGTTPDAVRSSLGQRVALTFQVELINDPGDSEIKVCGPPELGGMKSFATAAPTRKIGDKKYVTAPIDFLLRRGDTVDTKIFIGISTQHFTYKVKIPNADSATVRLHDRGTVTVS